MDHTIALIQKSHEGDEEARAQIVEENTGLVWCIVRRFTGRGTELEDLFQIGTIGLLKAIDKFDLSYEVKFSTYAVPMISGEIKRFLRDDGMIKVSRSLKELSYKGYQAQEVLGRKLGREPSVTELAEYLDVSPEELTMAMDACTDVESLHRPVYKKEGQEISLMEKVGKEDGAEESSTIDFLSYEEAVTYFDFDTAASNWCTNFGMDPTVSLEEAKAAILHGTDRELVIRLATFARDVGYGDEKLIVTNAFRPACYQEVIGLHDSNANTGPFRRALLWNGRSVTNFWWDAETAPGWPEDYAIDLSAYDIQTLDLRYYYRAALRLWDNTWANGYYARPGCSGHNSGNAMDISNYWLGANFKTSYANPKTGVVYHMADYGLYKPLQPSATTAGETWHITSSQEVLALGNYDNALLSGYEIVYALYYNPSLRGWSMADGRGVYIGAGVTVLQIELCRRGLLEEKYITGYFCSKTDEAVRAFQSQQGLVSDGIAGSGTVNALLSEEPRTGDTAAPELTASTIGAATSKGFSLFLSGTDEKGLNAFRVDTRGEGDDVWVTRYYNVPVSGSGTLDVDIWRQGNYAVRAAACDTDGNESPLADVGTVFIDTTSPVIRSLTITDITETGFSLHHRVTDNGTLAGLSVTLTSDTGETRSSFLVTDGESDFPWSAEGLTEGVWTISVTASDAAGNESRYTFDWKYTAGTARPGLTVARLGTP